LSGADGAAPRLSIDDIVDARCRRSRALGVERCRQCGENLEGRARVCRGAIGVVARLGERGELEPGPRRLELRAYCGECLQRGLEPLRGLPELTGGGGE